MLLGNRSQPLGQDCYIPSLTALSADIAFPNYKMMKMLNLFCTYPEVEYVTRVLAGSSRFFKKKKLIKVKKNLSLIKHCDI